MTHLVWFRNDLRTSDNEALVRACDLGRGQGGIPVRAVFLWTPGQWWRHDYGKARQHAWARALDELQHGLARLGIPLELIAADDWLQGVRRLIDRAGDIGAASISLNREFGWDEVRRDRLALDLARRAGLDCHVFEDRVARDPAALLTGQGEPYRVFTPYRKRWLTMQSDRPLPPPLPEPRPVAPAITPTTPIPSVDWPGQAPLPLTERQAHQRLDAFVTAMTAYREKRDQPAEDGTSRLSAALANGAISLRQCLHSALTHPRPDHPGVRAWLSELIWRDFYHYLLYWRPELAKHQPFYPRWDAFPWADDDEALAAWQAGRTGVPIVDAGMRQLAASGWMHNRMRMIVAMYLVKLLKIDWRAGERWFARHLLDIDFASNNGGWQWCASTGVDAAPYFRIFNPHTQSRRFDPAGDYIRHWVPELAGLDAGTIHDPPPVDGYPAPLVDYRAARASTLAAFQQL